MTSSDQMSLVKSLLDDAFKIIWRCSKTFLPVIQVTITRTRFEEKPPIWILFLIVFRLFIRMKYDKLHKSDIW